MSLAQKIKTIKKHIHLIVLQGIITLAAILFFIPVFFIISNSFKTDAEINLDPIALPHVINFNNYAMAWTTIDFPTALLNTFIITLVSTCGIVLFSSMAAYILVRMPSKLSWLIYLFFVFSILVPFQTFMIPLTMLSKDLGLQSILGIVPIYWGLGCPVAVFLYHGFIKGIPKSLEEAAFVDGASIFRVFFTIVFPLLTPITATVAILNVLWIWNDFLLPLIILPKQATIQLAQYGFFSQFNREYGPATASLVLSSIPIVLFYVAMQRFIVKGITDGAIKS
jgi:raffinose/stachyose/melibiose transport system permease protein